MLNESSFLIGIFEIKCIDKFGKVKWKEIFYNSTMDAAINDILTVNFKSGTQKANWYIGLKGSAQAISTGWTSADIGTGFTELVNYSEANRPLWNTGSVSAKSLSNTSNPATFTINGVGGTVYGAFIISVNTKSGTTGILWCVSNLATSRSVIATDVVTVTYTISMSTS